MVDVARVARIRRQDPGAIAEAWRARSRRPLLPDDGRLLIVAADHMARASFGVRDDPTAMLSRPDVLQRLATALKHPGVDGVLGTADVLEDLLLAGLLEDKIVIGSMNRGGLQGASFELDDRGTAYTSTDIAARGLDGGKMLLRICLDDPGTVRTMAECARFVSELAQIELMAMIEPFWSVRTQGQVRNLLDPESVMRAAQVVAGLGGTSAYTWLKLPVVDQMRRVLESTTLPVLLLGGDPSGDSEHAYQRWADALLAPTAAGLVVGRALLYPPDGDVASAVERAAEMVHG
ncbi:Cgl0159 family (beta/alpha)8-fold protein [Rudaeicoccus suwonensis]|uniref:DhnA family fructose-bisphosphate aldolase class Ia n=1 Tax=Rudaeicoccus suwonensis TaxID=657409 RepID=A0A561EBD3_9MICO|nr:deoxyribose-phosphate aldolase [Rudaeicoccus suwonensis]TWE12920.1 DhnA family fructose-bisphosphate aldolase class Ia [Rudaeicoccus suwonensis]